MAYVYILKLLTNDRYYIGSTDNFERRLIEHNSVKSKYTNLTRPCELVFSMEYKSSKKARQIECKLKKLKSKKIIEKIVI